MNLFCSKIRKRYLNKLGWKIEVSFLFHEYVIRQRKYLSFSDKRTVPLRSNIGCIGVDAYCIGAVGIGYPNIEGLSNIA